MSLDLINKKKGVILSSPPTVTARFLNASALCLFADYFCPEQTSRREMTGPARRASLFSQFRILKRPPLLCPCGPTGTPCGRVPARRGPADRLEGPARGRSGRRPRQFGFLP